MKTISRKIIISVVLGLLFIPSFAEEPESGVSASVDGDIVSSYVWRGLYCGGTSFQPSLSVEWKGLSLSGWGSVGIDKTDTKEFDLTLGYAIGGFSISVTDYYFDYFGVANPYGEYVKERTSHVFEGQIGYDFEFMSLNWYTNFAGADGVKNAEGDMAYSSYFSAAVPFEAGGVEWEAELGIVPWKTDLYGADGFALTNLSLKAAKSLKISDEFSLGVFSQAVWNPAADGGFLVMGLSF